MRLARAAGLAARALVGAAAVVCCIPASATAQIGPNCTVSVLNRSVTQNADGSWVLPNVPANFGPVRARVTCLINGETISGESDPFVVPANGVVNLPPLRFGQTTPIPTALTVSGPASGLTATGQTAQLVVTAVYRDGTTRNVTAASNVTTYTVSNPAIATVSGDGVVQAVQSGTVIIQAMHEGASGMTSVRVALGGGADSDGDGIPDADEVALGLNPNNAIDAVEDFDRDNLTNLQEYQLGTNLRVADTDGDGLRDGDEVTRGTNPLVRDTDGDGIGDGLEVQTGSDPLSPTSFNLTAALSGISVTPPLFTLTFNTIAGESSVQLRVNGALRDGTTLDLTSTARGTSYSSSNLSICSFSGTPGRVFAGQSGGCVINVTVAGFTATVNGTVNTFAPTALSSVALGGPGNGVDVAGPVVFVAAGGAGLQVIDVSNRAAPFVAATLALPGTANDVKLAGTRAYVAAGSAGLHVVDITTPFSPRLLGTVDTPGSATDVRARGTLAFVADGSGGLQVVDVSNAVTPRVVGTLATVGPANGVDVTDTLAVVAVGGAGVQVVNIANPALPITAGLVDTPGDAQDIVFDATGGFAYVADYTGSMRAIDVRNPAIPRLAGVTTGALGGYLFDIARVDTFAFGADVLFVNGVPIVDVSDADNLRPRAILNFPGDATGFGIAVDGSYVYLGTDTARLYIGQFRIQQDLNGIPPTVSITSPAQGDTFVQGEAVTVGVSASDDLAVSEVALQVNGVTVARDTTAPYQFTVAAPAAPATVALGATAVDLGNNVGTAASVTVSIIPDPLTTVTGRVVLTDGSPMAGVLANCNGVSATTAADGTFTLPGVPTVPRTSACRLEGTATDGTVLRGLAAVTFVRGGITALGDVVIAPVPVISSITPNVIDSTRPPQTIRVTGVNLAGSTFLFLPDVQPPIIAIGTPVINATGTEATLPIVVSANGRGRLTLVGSNSFGGADPTATVGNTLTLISPADDVDTDGDGYPDGMELMYGSDPTNRLSAPDWSVRGDVINSALSVVNQAIPVGVSQSTTQWLSVRNRTTPTGVAKSATQWVSVRNNAIPVGVEKSATQWFSVRNTTLAVASRIANSPAVSVRNLQPGALVTEALRQVLEEAGLVNGGATSSPAAFSLGGVSSAERLVEGQTIVISADVPASTGPGSVTFTANDAALAFDDSAPYTMVFTVPANVPELRFRATFRSVDGRTVTAPTVDVGVDRDPGTVITGRVVDADGAPVADAAIELLSSGLTAEFFDSVTPLDSLPNLARATPSRVTRVTAINMRDPGGVFGFDPFGTGLAPDYAARFSGWLSVESGGTYTLFLGADAGARLRVGGVTVVDLPSPVASGYQESSGAVDLRPGLVPIEITFYESTGNAQLQLSMTGPGGERQVVPPESLVPRNTPFEVRTDSNGRFTLSGVPTVLENIRIRAATSNSATESVTLDVQDARTNGIVDVGEIAVPRVR